MLQFKYVRIVISPVVNNARVYIVVIIAPVYASNYLHFAFIYVRMISLQL